LLASYYCFSPGSLVIFVKKTQKTPASELELARKRMAEYLAR
jgi:phage-related protein